MKRRLALTIWTCLLLGNSPALAQEKRDPNIENSIGMKLVRIPAGEFLMGSSPTDIEKYLTADSTFTREQLANEQPQHRVKITRAFYLGMFEVTQSEYERVMGYNPSWFSKGGRRKNDVLGKDTSAFPVDSVGWNDAQEFCRRLSALDTEKLAGRRYGLPTEAQWEYACRAGTTTAFHFGDTSNGSESNVTGNEPFGPVLRGPNLQRTTTVGSYKPNAFGLFDMHGNVWEWCADYYHGRFYDRHVADDPVDTARSLRRVKRGGGWYGAPRLSRAALRASNTPTRGYIYDGFRVVILD
jgi:formylglycine-generating enzyme required for sulfatase activity